MLTAALPGFGGNGSRAVGARRQINPGLLAEAERFRPLRQLLLPSALRRVPHIDITGGPDGAGEVDAPVSASDVTAPGTSAPYRAAAVEGSVGSDRSALQSRDHRDQFERRAAGIRAV